MVFFHMHFALRIVQQIYHSMSHTIESSSNRCKKQKVNGKIYGTHLTQHLVERQTSALVIMGKCVENYVCMLVLFMLGDIRSKNANICKHIAFGCIVTQNDQYSSITSQAKITINN